MRCDRSGWLVLLVCCVVVLAACKDNGGGSDSSKSGFRLSLSKREIPVVNRAVQ
jgi:hypothetical protein